jgi:hypothetical protein
MLTVLGVVAFVLVLVVIRGRRKRAAARNDMTSAIGAATPRPWTGPARWNGKPSLRMPVAPRKDLD